MRWATMLRKSVSAASRDDEDVVLLWIVYNIGERVFYKLQIFYHGDAGSGGETDSFQKQSPNVIQAAGAVTVLSC